MPATIQRQPPPLAKGPQRERPGIRPVSESTICDERLPACAQINSFYSIPRGLLRYHGVFRQGKRGKTSARRSIRVHADRTAPGTTVYSVLPLTRIIHDGSWPFGKAQGPEHSRGTKSRSRVARPARGAVRTRCILVQYVEGPRGEPAGRRLVVAADRRLQQKCS